jgi:cysteine desulfurase family protein (TIGR01976 family)
MAADCSTGTYNVDESRMSFPIDAIRSQFPALQESRGTIFFDNAAGAQLPARVVDAVRDHLVHRMVQRGGPYTLSREVDDVIGRARVAVADLVKAPDPNEIVFGLNGTSFMRLVSQTVAEQGAERNEIIVTELDHEANISVWLDLQKRGFTLRFWPLANGNSRLDLEDLAPLLSNKTRLVAVTWASNATGSLVDVAAVAAAAHAVGAEVFVDAVHYLPHGPIDVQSTGIDYMACSTYKAFAPHMGFGWGRKQHLDNLPAFREYFIPDVAPYKFEIGTYVYENVSGLLAAIDYLEDLGRRCGADGDRRQVLHHAMQAIRSYEMTLSDRMLRGLEEIPSVREYGLREPQDRTPTFCFTVEGLSPAAVCENAGRRGYAIRYGHLYCPRLIKRLGLSEEVGAVRASLVHYNTADEIDGFLEALRRSHP